MCSTQQIKIIELLSVEATHSIKIQIIFSFFEFASSF